MIIRKVNGGLNRYEDRFDYFDRSALVVLGCQPTDICGFQSRCGLLVDGISGPQTWAAMHRQLVALLAGVIALVAVLLFLRRRDQRAVAKQVGGMG
ncbi:peptidoglycan-binding domain-containing protein [Neorhizobium petrolearium]|uniref:peptidoglycan-binding domain-containing protein n=1 Tax=Neorhizobium petrolearium TaxID=515361 RepID=UPI003F17F49A